MSDPYSHIKVRIPKEYIERLKIICAYLEISVADLMRQLVASFLKVNVSLEKLAYRKHNLKSNENVIKKVYDKTVNHDSLEGNIEQVIENIIKWFEKQPV